mgnify:CR=1 FL=1
MQRDRQVGDVADGDVQRHAVALVVDATRAHREDLALLRLLLGGVRDDQAGGGGLLGLERLDDDAVLERLERNRHVGSFDSQDVWAFCVRQSRSPSRGSSALVVVVSLTPRASAYRSVAIAREGKRTGGKN